MSKFNRPQSRAAAPPLARTTGTTVTFEGAPAVTHDARTELFRLAVQNFVGEDTFYETAGDRDSRFSTLVRDLAVSDTVWLSKMLIWLRTDGNMRSAPLAGAAQAVHARAGAGLHKGNRHLVSSVLQRADEPGEFLAYWRSQFGRTLPNAVLNGVGDAVTRLYNERSFLKWDSSARGYRFADVLRVTHARPGDDFQQRLHQYILDGYYDKDTPADGLPVISARRRLMALPAEDRRRFVTSPGAADRLAQAGMTWEALAGWLQGPMDKEAWEAVIPSMGYMALIRNLRSFDEAGVSRAVCEQVIRKITDPGQVARSRQLPFRFLSAYENCRSDLWKQPLSDALELSLKNVPDLDNHTLVLVDTSGSMRYPLTANSSVSMAKAAAVFGASLAVKNGRAQLYGFAGGLLGGKVVFEHPVPSGTSVLKAADAFVQRIGEVGHGTMISEAVRQTYRGQRRVVLISDEQSFSPLGFGDGGVLDLPDGVQVYGINLGGYAPSLLDTGMPNRHPVAGLTDAVFSQIRRIEDGLKGRWPWE